MNNSSSTQSSLFKTGTEVAVPVRVGYYHGTIIEYVDGFYHIVGNKYDAWHLEEEIKPLDEIAKFGLNDRVSVQEAHTGHKSGIVVDYRLTPRMRFYKIRMDKWEEGYRWYPEQQLNHK